MKSPISTRSFGGRIEGGYRFATAFAGITPYAEAQAQAFHTPGYRETDLTGGGFGLTYASRNATSAAASTASRW